MIYVSDTELTSLGLPNRTYEEDEGLLEIRRGQHTLVFQRARGTLLGYNLIEYAKTCHVGEGSKWYDLRRIAQFESSFIEKNKKRPKFSDFLTNEGISLAENREVSAVA